MERARGVVFDYVRDRLEKTDTTVDHFTVDDVYVVWGCKTLQNSKCLVSTTIPDGMYYEVTYDGNKSCFYLDAYKKFENVKIEDEFAPQKG
jgi:hypothetical protein